jgi:hypothetical protein
MPTISFDRIWHPKEPTRTNALLAHPMKKHYLCKAKLKNTINT